MNIPRLTPFLIVAGLATAAWAIKPGQWVHQTESDFASAELENVVVTNLGDVRLARQTESIADLPGDDSIVYDLHRMRDGRTFAAVGPQGKLVEIAQGAVATIGEYPGAQVFALAPGDNEGLWVAISGSPSRLELRSGPQMTVTRTIEVPDVRYIWDLVAEPHRLWLATGTGGRVLAVRTDQDDARPNVVLDTPHANLLCLGRDDRGRIFAGSDGDGIVYRFSSNEQGGYETFVVYDAPEPEIGAILVQADGTLFIGTADVEQAKPGRLAEAQSQQVGRIERPSPDEVREKIPNVPPKPEPRPSHPGAPPAAAPDAVPQASALPPPDSGVPTAQQYDQLRNAVRQRLEQYRQTGRVTLQAAPDAPGSQTPGTTPAPRLMVAPGRPATPAAGQARKGNAIYRISPDGFAREIFRESTMILRIVQGGSYLYVATGNEGELFRLDPEAEELTLLARLSTRQIPALWRSEEGAFLLGTANPGRIVRLDEHFSPSGTLRSGVLDASQISLWGKLQLVAESPGQSSVEVQTRSGNVAKAEDGAWWSPWSQPVSAALDGVQGGYVDVLSPPARYLQYRMTLRGDGDHTPTVRSVALRYLTPNMQPKITSIKTDYPARPRATDSAPQPLQGLKVDWEASDPNGDRLTFRLEVRPADAAEDDPFITLAKDLTASTYEWDTRTIDDGRYLLRITASDASDNVPDHTLTSTRRSDPVTVDNTPPEIDQFQIKPAGDRSVEVSASVSDSLSPVAEVRYRVSGDDAWKPVLPTDLIYDSTREHILVKISDLSVGVVNVTLRVTDAQGNSRYASRTVKIE